jgi:hypothetical protein
MDNLEIFLTQLNPDEGHVIIDDDIEEHEDPFFQVRSFITNVNKHMNQLVSPGQGLILDETMIPLHGMTIDQRKDGLPTKVSIQRKPEGTGLEIKTVACGETNIMIFFELQEGKDRMKTKKYREVFPHHTALSLRLTDNWKGTCRVVYGDAYFAFVSTLMALRGIHNLYFIGHCKTASKLYPKKFLHDWHESLDLKTQRGEHIVLVACDNMPNEKIFAVGYADQKLFTFIANAGTTIRTTDIIRTYKKNIINEIGHQETITYDYITPRIQLVTQYFEHSGLIDIFNQKCQGVLKPHKHLPTRTWWLRVFDVFLGIFFTNAYYIYKHDRRHLHEEHCALITYNLLRMHV